MLKKFQCGDEEFEFDIRTYYQRSCIVVNVKNPCLVDLATTYATKLSELEDAMPGTEARLHCWAWESAQEWWWWSCARDLAKEYDIGPISSGGRGGGWLVLDTYTEDALEGICIAYMAECRHCKREYKEHPKGKCLFDSGRFQSVTGDCPGHLRRVVKFTEEIAAAVDGATDTYLDEFIQRIDDAWDVYEKNRRQHPKQEAEI